MAEATSNPAHLSIAWSPDRPATSIMAVRDPATPSSSSARSRRGTVGTACRRPALKLAQHVVGALVGRAREVMLLGNKPNLVLLARQAQEGEEEVEADDRAERHDAKVEVRDRPK